MLVYACAFLNWNIPLVFLSVCRFYPLCRLCVSRHPQQQLLWQFLCWSSWLLSSCCSLTLPNSMSGSKASFGPWWWDHSHRNTMPKLMHSLKSSSPPFLSGFYEMCDCLHYLFHHFHNFSIQICGRLLEGCWGKVKATKIFVSLSNTLTSWFIGGINFKYPSFRRYLGSLPPLCLLLISIWFLMSWPIFWRKEERLMLNHQHGKVNSQMNVKYHKEYHTSVKNSSIYSYTDQLRH